MNQTEKKQIPEAGAVSARGGKIKWIVGVFLLLFAAAAAMNLPRGYSDDLSHIGKGHATIVLVRDKNAVASFDLIHVLDNLRNNYAGKVEFLLTDFNTPEGKAFIAANQVTPVTLVLFDASGKQLKVLHAPQTAESVQQEIATVLGVRP
jgi:hypothetical protein